LILWLPPPFIANAQTVFILVADASAKTR